MLVAGERRIVEDEALVAVPPGAGVVGTERPAPLPELAHLDLDDGKDEDLEASVVGGAHQAAQPLVGDGGAGDGRERDRGHIVLPP